MAIGLVSDEDFELEVGKVVDRKPSGRSVGDNNVPPALRQIIAETAISEGNDEAKRLAKSFGISDSSVSAYKHGANSTDTYNQPERALLNANNRVKDKIRGKAFTKLEEAIDAITETNLNGAKVRDIAAVAQSMSIIAKNMDDDVDTNRTHPANFVIFAPIMMQDNEFKTVVINEAG